MTLQWRWLRAILHRWVAEVVWLLEYEPTWFPEFGLAIGAVGWGLGCFVTDDIGVRGGAYVLPVLAIALGIARGLVLLRLWYGCRVMLTSCSALLIAWLWWSLFCRYGVLPMLGWMMGAFVIEMLTAAKFSIPCAREIRDEIVRRAG